MDLIDESGSGAVLIWSYGLPFLPGLASSARNGQAQSPGDRPSYTLSIFDHGKPTFYILSEYDRSECTWEPDKRRWSFGQTQITHTESADGVELFVSFHAEAPGFPGPMTGTLSLKGPLRTAPPNQQRHDDHSWEPLCLGGAHGSIQIACGDYHADITGRIYYDRNAGDRPLHELGIRDWYWGRFAFPDHEVVVYLLNAEDGNDENYVLRIDSNGTLTHEANATTNYTRYATTRIGSRYPTQIDVARPDGPPLTITLQTPMDDSPFYRRFVGSCEVNSVTAMGIFEHVLPHATDPAWMRPLIHMRIHQTQRANSIWLPLFCGPKLGRWGRLFQSWLPTTGRS